MGLEIRCPRSATSKGRRPNSPNWNSIRLRKVGRIRTKSNQRLNSPISVTSIGNSSFAGSQATTAWCSEENRSRIERRSINRRDRRGHREKKPRPGEDSWFVLDAHDLPAAYDPPFHV